MVRAAAPICPVLTRAKQPLHFFAHNCVALAGTHFEPTAVKNVNETAAVSDKPRLLQNARRQIDALALHAEHHRKKFLRERQAVEPDAFVGHQYPTAESLLNRMQAVTGS